MARNRAPNFSAVIAWDGLPSKRTLMAEVQGCTEVIKLDKGAALRLRND
jgi:hypothetical protein